MIMSVRSANKPTVRRYKFCDYLVIQMPPKSKSASPKSPITSHEDMDWEAPSPPLAITTALSAATQRKRVPPAFPKALPSPSKFERQFTEERAKLRAELDEYVLAPIRTLEPHIAVLNAMSSPSSIKKGARKQLLMLLKKRPMRVYLSNLVNSYERIRSQMMTTYLDELTYVLDYISAQNHATDDLIGKLEKTSSPDRAKALQNKVHLYRTNQGKLRKVEELITKEMHETERMFEHLTKGNPMELDSQRRQSARLANKRAAKATTTLEDAVSAVAKLEELRRYDNEQLQAELAGGKSTQGSAKRSSKTKA